MKRLGKSSFPNIRLMLRKRGTPLPAGEDKKSLGDASFEQLPVPIRGQTFDHANFNKDDFDLPAATAASRSKAAKSIQKMPGAAKPMPVIVVTDIGADIDDTLALFVLLGAMDAVRIVAVVTSVNNGLHRGAVTRGFLRMLGISDDTIEILPSVDGCVADCYIPDSFPTAKEAALGSLGATPKRIVEICKEHQETGILIYGIASLSPIADAIALDKAGEGVMQKAVAGVYLQGNCFVSKDFDGINRKSDDALKWSGENVRILPNPHAYNFKNDMEAATVVFDYFQDLVPFTVLGKYAAYKVPIRKGDFSEWTQKISKAWKVTTVKTVKTASEAKVPNPTDLLLTAKRQMKRFRSMNPLKFDSIYNVPKSLTPYELEKFDWFDDLANEFVCSHPYDPLLGLRMVEDIRKKQGGGSINNGTIKAPLFEEYHARNVNGHNHVILGNIPERHSIPNVDYVHDVLVDHISNGLRYHGDSSWLN